MNIVFAFFLLIVFSVMLASLRQMRRTATVSSYQSRTIDDIVDEVVAESSALKTMFGNESIGHTGRVKYVAKSGPLSATVVGMRVEKAQAEYALRRRGHRNGPVFWRSSSEIMA